ncbi:spindle and kinetochore-associated protein 1-like [Polyodon spathula]|uniref:spindle and kinetochore-associated protein 1-like n=1 Tax=Polyodon spathula TaxID=7913 RepID=UPI001B7E9099|nr:spindle and kinetochore-associated protein 1-like [Polyodon spathula]
MDSSELEDLTQHINDKISGVLKSLHLRTLAKDPDKRNVLKKISQDLLSINNLLNQFEAQVNQQKEILKSLKELEKLFEEDKTNIQLLFWKICTYDLDCNVGLGNATPSYGIFECTLICFSPFFIFDSAAVLKTSQEPESNKEFELLKKPSKHKDCVQEMLFITTAEFENIPAYMKGRLTYDQINNVIQDINKAVVCKYKILKQSLKSMNNATRKLYQRFKDEECKETKGQYFVVDADIKEFTQMKVEKKFHVMLNMLRHCQRLREVRGGGITRYMLQ